MFILLRAEQKAFSLLHSLNSLSMLLSFAHICICTHHTYPFLLQCCMNILFLGDYLQHHHHRGTDEWTNRTERIGGSTGYRKKSFDFGINILNDSQGPQWNQLHHICVLFIKGIIVSDTNNNSNKIPNNNKPHMDEGACRTTTEMQYIFATLTIRCVTR